MTVEDYQSAAEIVSGFRLEDFHTTQRVAEYTRAFALDTLLDQLEQDHLASLRNGGQKDGPIAEVNPFPPEYGDLCRLHYLVLSRRVLNVLEFGSGYSTAIMAAAMRLLRREFDGWARETLRVETPFKVFSVEEDRYFADLTKKRLGSSLGEYADVSISSVTLTEHDFRYCTKYDNLPNISPDLIYLDGPSQYANAQSRNGFSHASNCRMPMASDILKLEFYFEPGTFIVVDGRTANARFLNTYLRRNWSYVHDDEGDVHYFELIEPPLGKYNKAKIEFCLATQGDQLSSDRWPSKQFKSNC